MLFDIKIDTQIYTQSFFDYLPCWNILNKQSTPYGHVLGVISLRDIYDDEELFLDYWDIFELQKKN